MKKDLQMKYSSNYLFVLKVVLYEQIVHMLN